jgi:hypothetical protein
MKVDVAINVYGKPYQTLVAILSLLRYSRQWIDKIYLITEREQPHNDNLLPILVGIVLNEIKEIEIYTPKYYLSYCVPYYHGGFNNDKLIDHEYRLSVRYQYAWEKTDKPLFICHNDMLFKGDQIGAMIEAVSWPVLDNYGTPYAGAGSIGQCWNCPANKVCSPDKLWSPTYDEVIKIITENRSPRTKIEMIDKDYPMPMPECRLNEFACLINVPMLRREVMPLGDTLPFGWMGQDFGDTGQKWYRSLYLKGYRFLNFKIENYSEHAWITHEPTMSNVLDNPNQKDKYYEVEKIAFEYLKKEFNF